MFLTGSMKESMTIHERYALVCAAQPLLSVYRAMVTAREIDQREQSLVSQGRAFFHVSGAGHEGTAALAPHLTEMDWLHCHYRDKALLVMRGFPLANFFSALLCKAESPSGGRQMSAHLADSSRRVLSIVGPVGNNALQAAGIAATVRDQPSRPIVLCAVGDGTTQQGEFLEACAEAVRHSLPVLFLVEDNEWAISTTTTGKTCFSRPNGLADDFYGMRIHRMDGRKIATAYEGLGKIVAAMRAERGPVLVHFAVKRLNNHTNSDDQFLYRTKEEVETAWLDSDPIRLLEQDLRAEGIACSVFQKLQEEIAREVEEAVAKALGGSEPEPITTAKSPLPNESIAQPECQGDLSQNTPHSRITMREAIRDVLGWHLQHDPRVFLYGQDIEDPKGDVFGVTQGLSSRFPDRVKNSPLSESTIVGTSIGRALAGDRPVAFLQFADFLPLAFNQIASELGSMFWRTNGNMQAPVIIMVTCGGYRPGLGPFHGAVL